MLRLFRKTHGLSMEQLIEKMDQSGYHNCRSNISNIEKGVRKPSFEFIKAFMRAYPGELDLALFETISDLTIDIKNFRKRLRLTQIQMTEILNQAGYRCYPSKLSKFENDTNTQTQAFMDGFFKCFSDDIESADLKKREPLWNMTRGPTESGSHWLTQFRNIKKLTIADLCSDLADVNFKISCQQVKKTENNQRIPSWNFLMAIKKRYGIQVEQMLTLADANGSKQNVIMTKGKNDE